MDRLDAALILLEELVGRALDGNELSYVTGIREDFIAECDRCYQ